MRRLRRETKKHVNMRMEPTLVAALKKIASRRKMCYQELIREWLWEKVKKAEG